MRVCWIFVAVLTSHHELFRRKINRDYLFSEHRKRCRIILQKVQGIVVFKSKLFASRERSRFQRNVNTNDFVSHFFGWIFFFLKISKWMLTLLPGIYWTSAVFFCPEMLFDLRIYNSVNFLSRKLGSSSFPRGGQGSRDRWLHSFAIIRQLVAPFQKI